MVFYNFYEIKEIGRSTNFSFYYFHETNEIVEALGGPSSIVMPNFCKMMKKLIKIKLIKFSKTENKLINFQQDQER